MSRPRVTGSLLFPVLALLFFALPIPTWMIDRAYSNNIYHFWQSWVTALSNLAPFTFLDVLVLGFIALVIWRIARLVKLARTDGVLNAIWEGSARLIRTASLLVLIFLAMWGLNYRRTPLSEKVGLAVPSMEELKTVISDANALAARLRPPPINDYPGFVDVTRMLQDPLNASLARLQRQPLLAVGRPKYSLLLTPFFTRAGVNGMLNPFGLEAIIHPDLLPFERPFTVAHEWAHLAGAADEAEASAIGWLACMNGPPELAYSANIYLIVEAGNALPAPVWRELNQKLDAGIRTDLDALAHRQQRENPEVQRTAFRVYDQYLRANRVDDGVASYSRSLSLILSPPMREALSLYHVQYSR
jgi:uncharacterized protein DUF3810